MELKGTCLNVNIPNVGESNIKGIKFVDKVAFGKMILTKE